MPTRAYLRVDPGLRRHKREYPDGAFRAFVEMLCAGDGQERRGRFESRAVLRAVLGPRARWIPFLVEHEDVVEQPDGELYIDGWDEWQEGDVTVAERVARLRAKKAAKAPTVTKEVTPKVTAAVTRRRQTGAVRRAPSSGGISKSGGKGKSIPSSASPSHRARGRAEPAGAAGSSSLDLTADDPRQPVAKLLAKRFRYRQVTAEQWATLEELVDNEYPVGTTKGADRRAAWQWLADLMAGLDRKAGDPIEAALTEVNRRIADRLAKADAAEQAWSQQKHQGPSHPGLATGAKQLAGRVTRKPNGKITPALREKAIAMLRQSRGLLDESVWNEYLARYQLTEADLEAGTGTDG